MLVLGFPEYLPQAQRLAVALNVQLQEVYLHSIFPIMRWLTASPV
jgi:hypothetical protein